MRSVIAYRVETMPSVIAHSVETMRSVIAHRPHPRSSAHIAVFSQRVGAYFDVRLTLMASDGNRCDKPPSGIKCPGPLRAEIELQKLEFIEDTVTDGYLRYTRIRSWAGGGGGAP